MPTRILVVDDEPDLELLIRQKFRKKIRAKEFDFLFAGNGVEALEKLGTWDDIDIVLTDINMPVMDGLTLLAELAKLKHVLKSVVVSAYGDIGNIRIAMNRGAFDFITKPIDFADLEVTLDRSIQELRGFREGLFAKQRVDAMEKELDVAARIQQSILPKTFPPYPDRSEFDIHAAMRPAYQVGGDFYDFYLLDDGHLGFVIADVAGKGVPAAIVMAVSRSLLKATAVSGAEPGQCVGHVNKLLCGDNTSGLFVTLFYGILDTGTGEIAYTNAGHNPPLHLSPGSAVPLENQGGLVLGVDESVKYKTSTLTLQPGESLFLYTDGVTEAMNSEKECYSEDRLRICLEDAKDACPSMFTQLVFDHADDFAGAYPQHDDITILAVSYHGANSRGQA